MSLFMVDMDGLLDFSFNVHHLLVKDLDPFPTHSHNNKIYRISVVKMQYRRRQS